MCLQVSSGTKNENNLKYSRIYEIFSQIWLKKYSQIIAVYLLSNGIPEDPIYEARNVFYIGKAISETIFSRAKKHVDSITMAKNRNNNPKTRPGNKFKEYSKQIGNNLNNLYIVPGYMHGCMSFEVSYAEEWLIWNYSKARGDIPSANTYAAKNL